MKKALIAVLVLVATMAGAATIQIEVADDILLAWANADRMEFQTVKGYTVEDAQARFQKYVESILLQAVNLQRERAIYNEVRKQLTPLTKVDEKPAAAAISAISVDTVKPAK